MKKIHRYWIGIAWCGLVALISFPILYKYHFSKDRAPQYLTAKVMRGDVEDAVLATGTLHAFKQVDVGAQVSGQLKTLTVKIGDSVKKDQWLAEIDPILSQNAWRQAQVNEENLIAQRRAAVAQLKQAELAYQRQQQMLLEDATARQDFESAQAQLDVQRAHLTSLNAQIKEARIQMETAQANLSYTRITAPMEGEVVAIVTQQGQTVIAQQEAPMILKLANLDTMTVKAQISEADVIRVHPGQDVYFTILGDSSARHYSKLRAIELVPKDFLDVQNKSSDGGSRPNAAVFYDALFEVPNPGHRLRIAMTAQVRIVLGVARHALYIPVAALGARNEDGSYSVQVLGADGEAQTRNVRAGINNSVQVEVLAGLNEGDELIVGKATDRSDTEETAGAGGA